MTHFGNNCPHLDDLDKALQQIDDERILRRQDVWVWYVFNEWLVNLGELQGWEYCGQSFTLKQPMSLLVVRATLDGIPHVAFSSGRTPTACMRAFLRKADEGWLEWSVDRFR